MRASFAPGIDHLLAPIPGEDPGGEWLRYTEVYDAVQEARRADDPSLPQGIWQRELKKADWGKLAELCEHAIEHRSKDLYLAVWLVEAWLHRYGPAGIAAGLRLLSGLCRGFWTDLYPRIDPNDPEVRAAPFEWLNDKIPVALNSITISQPDSPDGVPFTWGELVAVRSGMVSGKKAKDSGGDESATATQVQSSIALTPQAWFRGLASQIDDAVDATALLFAQLMEHLPDAPPSLRRIEEALQDMQRWVYSVIDERVPAEPAPAPIIAEPITSNEDAAMPLAEDGVVRSREEAYRLLALASDYLMRTEPHSPTPYLVQRAVNWGRMPLSELLEEYSQDGNDLRMLRLLLGLTDQG